MKYSSLEQVLVSIKMMLSITVLCGQNSKHNMINLATKQSKVENETHIRGHFASTACTLYIIHSNMSTPDNILDADLCTLFIHINYERVFTEDNTIMIISEVMHRLTHWHSLFLRSQA